MNRGRERGRAARGRRAVPAEGLRPRGAGCIALLVTILAGGASAADGGVRIQPSTTGHLGSFLVTGPYPARRGPGPAGPPPAVPLGEAEIARSARKGARPAQGRAWTLASSGDGPIDLAAALSTREKDVVAYAAGVLEVTSPGRHHLLLGVDDGVRAFVDGKLVHARDESRPFREDDDAVPIDLDAGSHTLLFELHQRDGAWLLQTRIVDARFEAPAGLDLYLPGTDDADARDLASRMSWVSLDRGARAEAWRPSLTVRFPEGAPRGVPLGVSARAMRAGTELFDVHAGEVRRGPRGVEDLVVTLPWLDDRAFAERDHVRYVIEAAGRRRDVAAPALRITRRALAAAARALSTPETAPLAHARASLSHLAKRLRTAASRGDAALDAQQAEAQEILDVSDAIAAGKDPYATRTGASRRALVSPIDGALHEVGVYAPRSWDGSRRRSYPLIVALHGMNGRPMAMIRWVLGRDEPTKDQLWEERHTSDLPDLDAFVIAPEAHGDTMYRELGMEDVERALAWALDTFPVDRDRISITGPSMGGIGAAAIALRRPHVFSAAMPLCGYHSYFVRRDVRAHALRPWERFLAEERSNVWWAEGNGAPLPLWIVHGKRDLPEENSGVLIDKWLALGYSVRHDHPDLGHNVWQSSYEGLRGASWLTGKRRAAVPRRFSFRTTRPRAGQDAWLEIRAMSDTGAWAEVTADRPDDARVVLSTTNVAALRLDRRDLPAVRRVEIDGQPLEFAADEPLELARGATWRKGTLEPGRKQGRVTGPIRDAFHEPLLFVYGTADPAFARVDEEVARSWARIRGGVHVSYPVMSDAEFLARREPIAHDRALFLVGPARANRVTAALGDALPIHEAGGAIHVGRGQGQRSFAGADVGAVFIRPNPLRPDRYVIVVEGTSPLAVLRSISLPDLVPDFVVYDDRVAPARGQTLLGPASVLAAGFFGPSWEIPAEIADPLAGAERRAPRTEHEATPYLP